MDLVFSTKVIKQVIVSVFLFLVSGHWGQGGGEGCGWQHGAACGSPSTGIVFGTKVIKEMMVIGLYS